MRVLTLLAGAVVVVTTINQGMTVDTIAEDYVKLVLAVGQHDADFVDAYYGPPEWKKRPMPRSSRLPISPRTPPRSAVLHNSQRPATKWQSCGGSISSGSSPPFPHAFACARGAADVRRGIAGLGRRHRAHSRSRTSSRFWRHSKNASRAPARSSSDTTRTPLLHHSQRKLDQVFKTAIAACRERTVKQLALPVDESFTVDASPENRGAATTGIRDTSAA